MSDLLHLDGLRRLHAQGCERADREMADRNDPVEGFARIGVCAGCVVDMTQDLLAISAQQIGVEPPSGRTVLPLFAQVFAYGVFLGIEIEREGLSE